MTWTRRRFLRMAALAAGATAGQPPVAHVDMSFVKKAHAKAKA